MDAVVEDAGVSDLEYLKSRMRQGAADDDEDDDDDVEEASDADDTSAAERSAQLTQH